MQVKVKIIVFLVLHLLASQATVLAALDGNYTIGLGIASSTNYLSFNAAVQDMQSGTRSDGGPSNGIGVSGPVLFTISAGTYVEHINIPFIVGASAINTITFDGVDPLTRILSWNSISTGDYTIQLNGAKHIRFQNLGIANNGMVFGHGIRVIGASDSIQITNCKIELPVTSTNAGKICILAATTYTSYGAFASNLTVSHNTIIGGYIGIVINGQAGNLANGILISDNTITDPYYSGVYLTYVAQAQVLGNEIAMRIGNINSLGMQLRYMTAYLVDGNKIIRPGAYGLFASETNSNTTNVATISNNMIGGGFQSTTNGYGISLNNCRYLNIYHNSIRVDNPGASGTAFHTLMVSPVGLDIRNNSFATFTPGANSYALHLQNIGGMVACDYNLYYSAGNNLAFFQGNYATLFSLQAGSPTFNQNCQVASPNYNGVLDLHTSGPVLNNWAINLSSVSQDFDGDSRPFFPDVIKDVGADEFYVVPFDADLVAISNPSVLIVGPNTIQVQINNNGSNSLNGIPISLQYSIDGGSTWPVTQLFVPTALGNFGTTETFSFSTAAVIGAIGVYNVCVRISPSIAGDPDPNDQICNALCTGFSGTLTINSGFPTAGLNFNNFADCATALGNCGVNGAVTINIASGIYNEAFTLNAIPGASPLNTITFSGGDTSLVTLQKNILFPNSAVITINGADYVRFTKMRVISAGVQYGSGFKLTNAADHNRIDSCVIELPANATLLEQAGILAAGTTPQTFLNSANDLLVLSCSIRGGFYGIRINGSSINVAGLNNRIFHCNITGFYGNGIAIYFQNAPELIGNTIVGRTSGVISTISTGLYSYYANGSFRIEENTIHSVGNYAIYSGYGNYDNSGTGRIVNNMLGGNFLNSSVNYCIYLSDNRDVDLFHNSLYHSGIGNALYLTSSSPNVDSIRIFNNILSCNGAGIALTVVNPITIQGMDHNIFHNSGTYLVAWGGLTYSSLAAFRIAAPLFNFHSMEVDPNYNSSTDLHLNCSPADGSGMPIGSLADIDLQARSLTTPDIGADEFTGSQIMTNLGADTTVCSGLRIQADSLGFSNFVWGGGQTTNAIFVTTSGYYSLLAIDSNSCIARDTILVIVDSLPQQVFNGITVTQCDTDSLDAQNGGCSFLWSFGNTNQKVVPPSAGTYSVQITTTAGCMAIDTINVVYFPNPTLNLGPDSAFCNGNAFVLNAGNGPIGTNYAWSVGANSQVLAVSIAGTYSVTVTSPDGCISADTINLGLFLTPIVNLGPDQIACDSVILDAGNPGSSFYWNTGATTQSIGIPTAGNYTVLVTNMDGCTGSDQINIVLGTNPIVNLGPDQIVCPGELITLDAGNAGFHYLWNNGVTLHNISTSAGGTYSVTVTNPNSGCFAADTVQVIASVLQLNLGVDRILCPGDTFMLNAGSSAVSYLWNTGATTQMIAVNVIGSYFVQVGDTLGCMLRDTVNMVAGASPIAAFAPLGIVQVGQPIHLSNLSSNGGTSWFWDFGDGVTSTLENPIHTYQVIGSYTVCLTASNGICSNTVCKGVLVGQVGNDSQAFLDGKIILYPNPNNGKFSLDFDLPKFVDLNIEVWNVAGQMTWSKVIKRVKMQQEPIDIQIAESGIYFLKIASSKGEMLFRKFVIE